MFEKEQIFLQQMKTKNPKEHNRKFTSHHQTKKAPQKLIH